MAHSRHCSPQTIIRVEVKGPHSSRKSPSDTARPLSSPSKGRATQVNGSMENGSLARTSQNRGIVRPRSSDNRINNRPQCGDESEVGCRPSSCRLEGRLNVRPLSAHPASSADILPDGSGFNNCHDNRPQSSRTPSHSTRRPTSSPSSGQRPPASHRHTGRNRVISAKCSLFPSGLRVSRQHRPSSESSSRHHHSQISRPLSSSRSVSRSRNNKSSSSPSQIRKDSGHHSSSRSPSPSGREASCPRPLSQAQSRRRLQTGRELGKEEQRPRSSHVGDRGRMDSSKVQNSSEEEVCRKNRKKSRPWTAPASGRGRFRENLAEETQRAEWRPWMAPNQVSDETKRKQEEIVRKILEEFDLEETMSKYRNSNVFVYRRTGKSLADFRFRSELIRMMGSEEIRLNDQEWSHQFQQKLREDYERLLDEQERNLAFAEKKRMHRLRVEGILQDTGEDLIVGYSSSGSESRLFKNLLTLTPLDQSSKKKRGAGGGGAGAQERRRRRKLKKWGEGSQSHVPEESEETKPVFVNPETEQRARAMVEYRQDKIYQPPEDVGTQMDLLRGEEQKEAEEKKSKEKLARLLEKGSGGEAASSESSSTEFTSRIPSVKEAEAQEMAKKRKMRRLPPNVAKLYEIEQVDELYDMAEALLRKSDP